MKRSTQLKLNQLKVILIAWAIMGFLISVYDHLTLFASNAGFPEGYSFLMSGARNAGAGIIGALTGGSFMVFYVNTRFHDKPYHYTIISVTVVFFLVVTLVSVLMNAILNPVQAVVVTRFKAALAWYFVVATTQLLLQVNSKFGQADFWNIMRGKYNQPKEEKRIFMFLDINSSTTIAEQLGDEKYHALLKDFFADIAAPILENGGNIYQYVGDEVVIAWDYEEGKKDMHCIRSFYDMKQAIQDQKQKYMDRYGFVPSFKAGVHCGRVVAGEVGIIKRDITYSGDVLNTTSRILSKCGELKEEIIASADLLSQFDSIKSFIARPLGGIRLKGKQREVMLNALRPVINYC